VSVTFTASWEKIFDPNPRIGFLSHARQLASASVPPPGVARLIFNDRLDAAVTAVLIVMVALILGESVILWWKVGFGYTEASVREAPFVPTHFALEEE
jgi:carbon starvation protein